MWAFYSSDFAVFLLASGSAARDSASNRPARRRFAHGQAHTPLSLAIPRLGARVEHAGAAGVRCVRYGVVWRGFDVRTGRVRDVPLRVESAAVADERVESEHGQQGGLQLVRGGFRGGLALADRDHGLHRAARHSPSPSLVRRRQARLGGDRSAVCEHGRGLGGAERRVSVRSRLQSAQRRDGPDLRRSPPRRPQSTRYPVLAQLDTVQ